MTNNDFTNEITVRAFMNAQIIGIAQKNGDLKKATETVVKEYELPNNYDIQDNSWIVSLLYCLLVVPKALFEKHGFSKHGRHELFDEQKVKEMIGLFSIINGEEGVQNPFYFIKNLRDSVSHVHYSCDENMNFTFKNRKAKESPFHFECTITKENLLKFLAEFGKLMANNRFILYASDKE